MKADAIKNAEKNVSAPRGHYKQHCQPKGYMVEVANLPAMTGVIGHGDWKLDLVRVNELTPREGEVFLLLPNGWSYREMAAHLCVSERTVRAHLSAIIDKLELDSVLHARLASYGYQIECDSRLGVRENSLIPLTDRGRSKERFAS